MSHTESATFVWQDVSARWVTEHQAFFVAAFVAYLPVVFGLKAFMQHRQALDLRVPLFIWNVGLTLFSVVGAYQALFYVIFPHIRKSGAPIVSLCDVDCFNTPAAIWIFYFNVSKIFEFVDTIFLALRKKPIILLHWYHHIMTMAYCWYVNQYQYTCAGVWFAAMNLVVHSIMYAYYAADALGIRLRALSPYITAIQILQMVGGITILGCTSTLCPNSSEPWYSIVWGAIMYASYFVLFAQIFLDRYLKKKGKKQSAEKAH